MEGYEQGAGGAAHGVSDPARPPGTQEAQVPQGTTPPQPAIPRPLQAAAPCRPGRMVSLLVSEAVTDTWGGWVWQWIGMQLCEEIRKHYLKADFDKIFKLMALGDKIGKVISAGTATFSS